MEWVSSFILPSILILLSFGHYVCFVGIGLIFLVL